MSNHSISSIIKMISLELHPMDLMHISPLQNILPLKFSIYNISAGNISILVSMTNIMCYIQKLAPKQNSRDIMSRIAASPIIT